MRYNKDKQNRGKHWLKVGAWIFGIALFLFVGLFFLTIWLENKLERMVAEQSDGVYELNLFGLQLSPFIGNMSVDSLSLIPNYERWQQLNNQQKDVSPTLLDIQSREIQLNSLNYLAVLFGSDPQLDELLIQNPQIEMTVMREDTSSQQKPLHATVPDKVKGLQIGLMDLNNGKISYRDSTATAATKLSVEQFNLTVNDVKLDSQSFQAQDRAYYAASIVFDAAQVNFLQPNGLYRLTVDSVLMHTDERILQAKQLHYKPTTDPAGLSNAKGESTTHMDLQIASMAFSGVDFPAHSRSNHFIVQHLLVQDPSMEAFKDKKNFENKTKRPLPHEIVQQMKSQFLLDTIEFKSGYVRYQEIVPEAIERGQITLENINITIANVSNMPQHMTMENPAVIEARGDVMGKLAAKLTVRMPLLAENGYHTIHGEIEEANPEILNPMIAPTGFVRIESGFISRGSMDLELTNVKSTGTFHLIYSNFEIELLSKGTGGDQSLGKEILSELANWVAVKESNPDDNGEEPRVGEVEVERDEKKSMMSYWTQSMIDGFKSIATIL